MIRFPALAVATFTFLLGGFALLAQTLPPHEKAVAAAWESFKSGKFDDAIKHSDECIIEFRGAAGRRQKELSEKREEIPDGRVTDQQKKAIHNNGFLNDVATAYYIKARAAHKLKKKEESAKALAEAEKYPAARCWDDKGFFWSVADAARLFRANPDLADLPLHETLVALAWSAFERGDHAKAIEYADKCLTYFHAPALEIEKDLIKRKVTFPTGAVDEPTKKTIFSNGLLNDAGTAWFIKGRAAEARGDKKVAIGAYCEAVKLTLARSWNSGGNFFWSPSEGAQDRLDNLR
jgi:tetratricopeptide (TPR) repeat protein